MRPFKLIVITVLLGVLVGCLSSQESLLLSDLDYLIGCWNPSDIGSDDPSVEDYHWFKRTINGVVYKATSGDVYFEKRNNKVIFAGDGGALILDAVKKIRQRLIIEVHSDIGNGKDVSGEIRLLLLDNNHFCFTFAMPSKWSEYFGSENVVYNRADVYTPASLAPDAPVR
jgi:hypothetical protein